MDTSQLSDKPNPTVPCLTRVGKNGTVGAKQSPVNNGWAESLTLYAEPDIMNHHDTNNVQVTWVDTVAKVCLHGPDTYVCTYLSSSGDVRHRPLCSGIYQNSNKPIICCLRTRKAALGEMFCHADVNCRFEPVFRYIAFYCMYQPLYSAVIFSGARERVFACLALGSVQGGANVPIPHEYSATEPAGTCIHGSAGARFSPVRST